MEFGICRKGFRGPLVMNYPLALLSFFLIACSRDPFPDESLRLDELAIEVKGASREVGYTNKQAGFFYTETNGSHRNAWQGWHIMSVKMMNDYALLLDSTVTGRNTVVVAEVLPHQFVRRYSNGLEETVTLLDSIDAVVIELQGCRTTSVTLAPLFGDSRIASDFKVVSEGNVLLIAKNRHLQRTDKESYPVWIGMTSESDDPQNTEETLAGKDGFAPARCTAATRNGRATFILTAGDTEEETGRLAERVRTSYRALIASRKARMEALINRAYVRTSNTRFQTAIHWAVLSADALVMNQLKAGIFAGLPWFSNYWGRDSFISLPGATLVTGNFSDAKTILRSFAEWQQTDPKNPDEGRVPNIVTTTSIAYNTTDGTPWFTHALYEYLNYSGDSVFANEMYPIVRRAINGALRHRVDGNYFLTHADAETWMDAVGPEGPWSPRGNRANDIQALWLRQLSIGVAFAHMFGDPASAQRWQQVSDQLFVNFQNAFIDTTRRLLYDHLNADGTPDRQLRPNQLFALELIQGKDLRQSIFETVTSQLVYRHGVASLSQDDPAFHPYHHFEPAYVQDAAYHNGVVWTWLAGPWIKAATEFGLPDLAFEVTNDMVHQMLDRGAVGTISELLDAAPRSGEPEPRLSGTFSQAWSLAEFIRNFHQSYLGVSVDAAHRRLLLYPRLPEALPTTEFNVSIGSTCIRVLYKVKEEYSRFRCRIVEGTDSIAVAVGWPFPGGNGRNLSFTLYPGAVIDLRISEEALLYEAGSDETEIFTSVQKIDTYPDLQELTLAVPVVRAGLPSLKGPSHRLLNHSEIKAALSGGTTIYAKSDPAGDDKGFSGTFRYPLNTNFKLGILDATGLTVATDGRNVSFTLTMRNLNDPGWHPEYGFQLTYAAIAIDKEGQPGIGRRQVGRNSHAQLPGQFGFESIIYVGGGLRVEGKDGSILAEYLPKPEDASDPFGTTAGRQISFSIPVELLGSPGIGWKYYVLIGAQDDHGGAGIGEFRSVAAEATEWTGGGKRHASDANVYDAILPNDSLNH